MRHLGLFLLFMFCSLSFKGQDLSFRKYKYKWGPAPDKILLNEKWKNQEAVILEEDTKIGLSGNDVEKYMRIKYLTQKGIDKFSVFHLPESMDPIADYQYVDIRNQDKKHRPKVADEHFMKYFAARIIHPDGNIEEAEVEDGVQTEVNMEEVLAKDNYFKIGLASVDYRSEGETIEAKDNIRTIKRKYHSIFFKIKNIKPGDEVEINYYHYQYANHRIFFHGVLPKQKCRLSVSYRTKHEFYFSFMNSAEPQDSSIKEMNRFPYKTYTWNFENLPGCIDEVNSRYYLQLPYISYYYNPGDFYRENPVTHNKEVVPYLWSYLLLKYMKVNYDKNSSLSFEKSEDRNAINDLYLSAVSSSDTALTEKVKKIQEKICDDLGFKNDLEYRRGEDDDLERMGMFLRKNELREISRFHAYLNLLKKTEADFYFIKLHDIRTEKLDENIFRPEISHFGFFSVMKGNNIFYLRPKDHRFGFYLNEMPFYLENSGGFQIPQNIKGDFNITDNTGFTHNVNFPFVFTPGSNERENIRTANVFVKASLDSLKLSFNAKVDLQGQFSTLTRGFYQYGYIDTTVNPRYYQHISDIPSAKVIRTSVKVLSKDFPYKAVVLSSFTAEKSVREENKVFAISIENWFQHVINPGFDAKERDLAYYPDFRFRDSYKYSISFDKKISLLNAEELNTFISNSFGQYTFKISQTDDHTLLLESLWTVPVEKIEAREAGDVEKIFNAIAKVDQGILKLKVPE